MFFHHFQQGIQDVHMQYALVPEDKVTNDTCLTILLYDTLKRELYDTIAYKLKASFCRWEWLSYSPAFLALSCIDQK